MSHRSEKTVREAGSKDNSTPIYAAVKKYIAEDILPLHTPGHKQGRGMHAGLAEFLTPAGRRADVSLMDELDDLHAPTGNILAAQRLAAELFGAARAYFVVNGTTGAVEAMLLGALREGDEVIVPRNAHRSVFSGLVLAGARPVYVQPDIDEHLQLALGVTATKVARALTEYPNVRAIVLTYPNYYGVATDIADIVEIAHARGVMVLVDAAHGPHLGFSEALPLSARAAGADASAESTHKLLGSLTQTSMLFTQGDLIDDDRMREAVSLMQTTSPNELLLLSLDVARQQFAQAGAAMLSRTLVLADKLRECLSSIEGLWVFDENYLREKYAAAYTLDRTKITVNVSKLGITGKEAGDFLRWECLTAVELVDAVNVLLLLSFADSERELARTVDGFQRLSEWALVEFSKRKTLPSKPLPEIPPIPHAVMTPREAFFAPSERVNIRKALGRIAREQIMVYPPGIPLIAHGDLIDERTLEYILGIKRHGFKLVGASDGTLRTLSVIAENPVK